MSCNSLLVKTGESDSKNYNYYYYNYNYYYYHYHHHCYYYVCVYEFKSLHLIVKTRHDMEYQNSYKTVRSLRILTDCLSRKFS